MQFIDDEDKINDLQLFSEEELHDIYELCLFTISELMVNHPLHIAQPTFDDDVYDHVEQTINEHTGHAYNNEQEMTDIITYSIQEFFKIIESPRSHIHTFGNSTINIDAMTIHLNYLKNIKQPTQNTPEWICARYSMITASNAYKAFGSQSQQNQLIYEKCKGHSSIINNTNTNTITTTTNTSSTLHHGHKYEKVSTLVYEDKYNTTIAEFGCIRHKQYDYIGASPDGINVNPKSNRYGRGLEIKNIINREITLIPKIEYWIQMQLQMEVCDIDDVDFLETRFIEYASKSEFESDGTFLEADNGDLKGVILWFNNNGNPLYVYKPIHMDNKEFIEWKEKTIQDKKHLTFITEIYWKLDEFSCILVNRNRDWFAAAIHVLSNIWETILKERDSDFSHRQPKKRTKKVSNFMFTPEIEHV